MPVFRFDKASAMARGAKKALLNLKGAAAHGALPDARRRENRAQNQKDTWRGASEREIKDEITRLEDELRDAKGQLREAKRQRARDVSVRRLAQRTAGELETGALPDFVVIGAQKSGTTFFYHLLTQHPLVEPAALKRLV